MCAIIYTHLAVLANHKSLYFIGYLHGLTTKQPL